MAGELTEADLRKIVREEEAKAHAEREAKKVKFENEPESELEDGMDFPCPNCDYVAKEQFAECPRCHAGADSPIEWKQRE